MSSLSSITSNPNSQSVLGVKTLFSQDQANSYGSQDELSSSQDQTTKQSQDAVIFAIGNKSDEPVTYWFQDTAPVIKNTGSGLIRIYGDTTNSEVLSAFRASTTEQKGSLFSARY